MVDFETGIYASVETKADGQNGYGQPNVASGERGNDQSDRRPELTNAVDDFTCGRMAESAGGYHIIGHVRDEH